VIRFVLRVLFALAGSVVAGLLVAVVESIGVSNLASHRASIAMGPLFAVLFPLALTIGVCLGPVYVALEPSEPLSPNEHLQRWRSLPILERARFASRTFACVALAPVYVALVAHIAKAALASGSAGEAGAVVALMGLAALIAAWGLTVWSARWLRRLGARIANRLPAVFDPGHALIAGVVFALALLMFGISSGDTSGDGGFFAIFGVLKRQELDLRSAVGLSLIMFSGYLFPIFLTRSRTQVAVAFSVLCCITPWALVRRTARSLDPAVAVAIERHAPLGAKALATLRRITDRDHDHISAYFAGGDCDDRDPAVSPNMIDIPGDGIDQDCSGADEVARASDALSRSRPSAPLDTSGAMLERAATNLILITVDTLRTDVGFMGYPQPVTPELDKLAARGVVFDRAYALASYTGKSIGPMMIGRFPSETKRDGNHFNTYLASNVFLAERLKEQHFHTMGVSSLWYFAPWSGLNQGFDVWDLSSRPPGAGDKDNHITSNKVSDAALKLLRDEKHTGERFFLWIHYFDPHAEYLPHDGAPDFSNGASSALARSKALYDGEVWFTDRQIGRVLEFVAAQPWGTKTAVVVTADHGEAFGEHAMSWHGRELWESLVRVPLLISSPFVTPHHVPQKRSHIDLVPTMLALLGIPTPSELSGESLAPELYGSGAADAVERDVYIDMPEGPYNPLRRALIVGATPGKKLVHLGGQQYQLFDLAADPAEQTDLSRDPVQFKPMVEQYRTMRAHTQELYVAPVPTP
jgi:choline-sulfatase